MDLLNSVCNELSLNIFPSTMFLFKSSLMACPCGSAESFGLKLVTPGVSLPGVETWLYWVFYSPWWSDAKQNFSQGSAEKPCFNVTSDVWWLVLSGFPISLNLLNKDNFGKPGKFKMNTQCLWFSAYISKKNKFNYPQFFITNTLKTSYHRSYQKESDIRHVKDMSKRELWFNGDAWIPKHCPNVCRRPWL